MEFCHLEGVLTLPQVLGLTITIVANYSNWKVEPAQSLHIGLFLDPLRSPTFRYLQAIYFDLKVLTSHGMILQAASCISQSSALGTPQGS